MKKYVFLLFCSIVLSSCLNTYDEPNFSLEFLKIDSAITPASFTYNQTDSITIKYTLPNGCHSFRRLHYDYDDNSRIVAVISFVALDENCVQVTREEEYKFAVRATQREDYLFKFYKGKDANGNNLFDEVIVPVN